MRRERQQRLAFQGWSAEGKELVVLARLEVLIHLKGWVLTGPPLRMTMSADVLLDEHICNAAANAQQRQERREAFQRVIDAEMAQDPLF